MTGLPARWREESIRRAATGCWLWVDARVTPWHARALIARDYLAAPGGDCGVAPHWCVNPLHSPRTTRRLVGGVA